jgi:hypothetical protein
VRVRSACVKPYNTKNAVPAAVIRGRGQNELPVASCQWPHPQAPAAAASLTRRYRPPAGTPCPVPRSRGADQRPGAARGKGKGQGQGQDAAVCGIGRRSPLAPGFSEELGWGWALGWVWSVGSNLAPGPLGSVAGDPDRHRGWLLCPSSVPAAAGCRPGAEAARVPGS